MNSESVEKMTRSEQKEGRVIWDEMGFLKIELQANAFIANIEI